MADTTNEKWLAGIIASICIGFAAWVTKNLATLWRIRERTAVLESKVAGLDSWMQNIDGKLDKLLERCHECSVDHGHPRR